MPTATVVLTDFVIAFYISFPIRLRRKGSRGLHIAPLRFALGFLYFTLFITCSLDFISFFTPTIDKEPFLAGAEGLEPTTHGFGDRYSTN